MSDIANKTIATQSANGIGQKTVEFRGGGFAPQSRRWVGAVVFFFVLGFGVVCKRSGFFYIF
jgi:hypothetical protein